MSDYDRLVSPLVDTLRTSGHGDPSVTVTGLASAGATRTTLLVDVERDGQVVPAVAQIGTPSEFRRSATEEAALLQVAADGGVPVPPVLGASNRFGDAADGVLITEHVAGLSIPRQVLRSLADDTAGDGLAEQCGAALARLHQVPVEALPPGFDRVDPKDVHRDYLRKLHDQLSELSTYQPATRWGINWLGRNLPLHPPAATLVHGDFRNGNLLVDDGRLTAVLDWELGHIGDPMEDLAWLCVRMWRFGNDDRHCGGFGSVEALRRGYESAGGRWRQDGFRWWLGARSAWWAIGLARQAEAAGDGTSGSIVHAASGRRVAELQYDLLQLIRSQEGSSG